MPHFFFHVQSISGLIEDVQGASLPGDASALRLAQKASTVFIVADLAGHAPPHAKAIRIVDVGGRVVGVVDVLGTVAAPSARPEAG